MTHPIFAAGTGAAATFDAMKGGGSSAFHPEYEPGSVNAETLAAMRPDAADDDNDGT